MKPIIYVAHPVSGDVRGNIDKVLHWLRWLTAVDPSRIYIAPWVGEVQAHYDLDPIPEDFYDRVLSDDCEVVRKLDGILLVGTHMSRGMGLELSAARAAGKTVINMVGFGSSFEAERDYDRWCKAYRTGRAAAEPGRAYLDQCLEGTPTVSYTGAP